MSKLTEKLKTIGIFNPHTLVAIGHPIITLRKCGRCLSAAWLLSVKGRWFQDVPWYDNGSLSFRMRPRARPKKPTTTLMFLAEFEVEQIE